MRQRTETPRERSNAQEESPLRILVVEEERELENLLKTGTERQQAGTCEFSFARDGEEALRMARSNGQNQFGMIIVSSINISWMDGLALLDRLAGEPPDLKAVMALSRGGARNARGAMNRKTLEFIPKPTDLEGLERVIRKSRRSAGQREEARKRQEKLNNLESELAMSREIQQSILPARLPEGQECEISGETAPARHVGGDFYDAFRTDNGHIGLAVADMAGKGMPAALFMMASRIALKSAAAQEQNPGRVLEKVNRLLNEDNRSSMFVTMLYAVRNPRDGSISYANGGHCNPVIIHRDGSCSELPPTGGTVLALAPELKYERKLATIMPGETLLMYSDGVTETRNASGEELGVQGMRKAFRQNPPESAREAGRTLLKAVSNFAGRMPQTDDITCLTLHRKEKAR